MQRGLGAGATGAASGGAVPYSRTAGKRLGAYGRVGGRCRHGPTWSLDSSPPRPSLRPKAARGCKAGRCRRGQDDAPDRASPREEDETRGEVRRYDREDDEGDDHARVVQDDTEDEVAARQAEGDLAHLEDADRLDAQGQPHQRRR